MKKLQVLALAALVAFGFASCAKDNGEGNNPNGSTGEPAKMGLSFSLSTSLTRADGENQAASADEKLIQTVTVFIFDAAGNKAKTGAVTSLTVDTDGDATTESEGAANVDFTYDDGQSGTPGAPTVPTWILKNDKKIATESGVVQIYVAANLPSGSYDFANVNALLAAVKDVADMSNGAGEFTMFSELKNKDESDPTKPLNLQPGDYGTGTPANPYVNEITVSLGRVVSKVVGTWDDAATWTNTWSAGNGGITLTYTVEKLNVYNEAVESYLAQNYNDFAKTAFKTLYVAPASTAGRNQTNEALNDFDASFLKGKTLPGENGNMDISAHIFGSTAGPHASLVDLDGFYIGENNSRINDPQDENLSRQGNTTYAMIQTKVVVSGTAKWNDATSSVDWNTTPTAGTEDLWIVKYNGNIYITNVEADATEMATELTALADGNTIPAVSVKFPESKVHFRKWLNREGTNDYEIGRNQFIHVSVEGVTQLDNSFPGFPGTLDDDGTVEDEEDGEKPANPVVEPSLPVDPEAAYLIVKVNVLDWVYKDNSTVLE